MTDAARQSEIGQSFLGHVFDTYQNMMQIAACAREAARQKSVKSPLVLELSRRNTGLLDYLPEAQITHYSTHEENKPTLRLPFSLPFADKSFDCCFMTDAYEHLPKHMRPEVLGELLRVTDGLVLVGSPNGNEIVNSIDRMVFDFIWGKYAERFEPLDQHVGFGIEPLDETLESLKAMGADRVIALPCNYVYRWIHLILVYFDLQHRNDYRDLFEPFNRVYNERLAAYDYREPCYRYLIAIATCDRLDINELERALRPPYERPEFVSETDGMLVETFREVNAAAADQLRQSAEYIYALQREKETALQEIERLKQINRQLEQDSELRGKKIELLNKTQRGILNRMAARISRLIDRKGKTAKETVSSRE